ncbi:septal ring lytic transglycosylase RlpA family protein [Marinigracilibium pacificum]|uniref:Probable endolytic peptidoglycan transglycosylase RlpA n=1 Tax=Marinigracilibium pacificum TaxID=2729599 RepID=A0A848ITH8_9BACT|nr:septal ring lytic transglycosylase RlpA family protein [Marinigracilibium pacificum]NMM47066.1 septal ring lytic transglycosylase RlpA family protein [Marinigracilibium pacificum]
MKIDISHIIIFIVLFLAIPSNGIAQTDKSTTPEEGIASYYHDKFTGRPTASGEKYDPKKFTAAHPKLPFGTIIKVTNITTGASAEVKVNDRGPWVKGRIVDVSRVAAEQIGLIRAGLLKVKVEVVSLP